MVKTWQKRCQNGLKTPKKRTVFGTFFGRKLSTSPRAPFRLGLEARQGRGGNALAHGLEVIVRGVEFDGGQLRELLSEPGNASETDDFHRCPAISHLFYTHFLFFSSKKHYF